MNELIESYPSIFSTFVKNELKQLVAREEDLEYKKLSREIFSYGFNFLERYDTLRKIYTPYRFLKNLVTNKISMNNDQNNFVFNLVKGYNVSNLLKQIEIRDLEERNLYEKSMFEAIETLLKCENMCRTDKIVSSKKIYSKHY